jgi:lipopolysaccharide transport system ATP-binding protein
MDGQPETVLDYYNAMLAKRENQTVRQQVTDSGKVQTISGSGEATITGIELLDEQGECVEVVNVGQPVKLRVIVEAKTAVPELVLGYMIKDRLGQPVFGTNTYHLKRKLTDISSGAITTFLFSFSVNLGPGTYSIAVALHTGDTHVGKNYEWRDLAAIFNVINTDKEEFVGTAWLPPVMECYR